MTNTIYYFNYKQFSKNNKAITNPNLNKKKAIRLKIQFGDQYGIRIHECCRERAVC